MKLYLGCPIWSYKNWVGSFFPEGTKLADFLREYARRLNTVEGNTTFYAVPSAKTLVRWVEQTPETFRFCPKLPRTISHAGKLREHLDETREFVQVMTGLGARLGPMFLQLPPRYPPPMVDDLYAFLEAWERGMPLAVEVRHLAWFETPNHDKLNALLAEFEAARVVIDTRPIRSLVGDPLLKGSVYQRMLQARERKPDLPILPERTAPFVFLRYVGHPVMEHNTSFIEEWAVHMAAWLRQGVDCYVFCHCPDERLDPWLCREFHKIIAASAPVPPLPWDEADASTARQPRLF